MSNDQTPQLGWFSMEKSTQIRIGAIVAVLGIFAAVVAVTAGGSSAWLALLGAVSLVGNILLLVGLVRVAIATWRTDPSSA